MKGYKRKDGRIGIRNVVLVTYLVECAHHVAQQIASEFADEPVHLIGFGGCAPNLYAEQMMCQLCTHPNVGAVLIVSLGCENFHKNELMTKIRESNRHAELLVIQESGGTISSINRGIESVRRFLSEMEHEADCFLEWSDLVIGAICGGSDGMSGITANPSVGVAFDQLVRLGATCIFEEPGELIGCGGFLRERASDIHLGNQLYNCIVKANNYYKQMGHDSFSQGNAVGGLSTIEEKSLGSYCKSGSSDICGLIYPGQIPEKPGLYMMDIVPDGEAKWGFPNINDNAEIMEMAASGCHLILYTTGRGSVAGSAITPVIKICSNTETYKRMENDMDINAGRVISEGVSIQEIARDILSLIERTATNNPTYSEQLGHQEYYIGYKFFNCYDTK